MSVILPDTSKEVVNRQQADVKSELPESNPWLRAAFIKAIIQGVGNRIFDEGYLQMKNLIKQLSPFSAESVWLQFWADVKRLVPLAAQPAQGPVTFTGTIGAGVTAGEVVSVSEIEYTLDSTIVIAENLRTVSSLTQTGGIALCLTDDDHEFATGKVVTIAGVNEDGYNGDHTITVTGAKSFTFEVNQGTASVATGTITASMDSATGQLTADLTTTTEGGAESNLDSGAELTLQNTIAGIDDTVSVQWDGLTGGTDEETTTAYQARIVERWQNPLTEFNAARIKSVVKAIDGNTRVWVYQPNEGDVVAGTVKFYFARDNDDTIIPDSGEISDALAAVIAIKPGHTDDADVIGPGLTGLPIDIEVDNIIPNTATMRTAVWNTILSYYRGGIDESENHTPEKLNGAIQQTYDVQGGIRINSFTLVSPTTTEAVGQGEIATQGNTVINT